MLTTLPYALFLATLVGKSRLLYSYPGVWRVEMAVSVSIVAIGLIVSTSKRIAPSASLRTDRLPPAIRACLTAFLPVGVASCISQEHWVANLLFFAVWAGTIHLLCVGSAGSMRGMSANRRIDLAMLPLQVMVLGSVPFIGADTQPRFTGLYFGAITAAQMFGLTSLLLLWKIMHVPGPRTCVYWALFVVSGVCLSLTRTRASIFGACAALTICLILCLRNGAPWTARRRARAMLCLLLPLSIVSGIWTIAEDTDIAPVAEYLRVSGDYDDVVRNRRPYWESGISDLTLWNVFGDGPLAKYGGQLSTQESGYDRDLNMHNAFLSVNQCYGWVGAVMFIVFFVFAARTLLSRTDLYATLGLSLLVFGLVNCISENWLLTFASPFDVYSWWILGLTLATGPSRRYGACGERCEREPGTAAVRRRV